MGLGGPLEVLVATIPTLLPQILSFQQTAQQSNGESLIGLQTHIQYICTLFNSNLMNRQIFQTNKYLKAYNAAFPGRTIEWSDLPHWNLHTRIRTTHNIHNGKCRWRCWRLTPQLHHIFKENLCRQDRTEAGWKDTIQMNPGEVTRIIVRFTNRIAHHLVLIPQLVQATSGTATSSITKTTHDATISPSLRITTKKN